MEEKRFQYCSWYVKLWRRRYYFLVPYEAIKFYFLNSLYARKSDDLLDFRTCCHITLGLACCKMKWYYTHEEVRERMKKKLT